MNYTVQIQSQWKRQQQFDFYKQFTEPFYGLTADVDVTRTYLACKASGDSFFIQSLYATLSAINGIEEFRYRIADNEVRIYDTIGVSATVARENGTFGFSYIDFDRDIDRFTQVVITELNRVKQNSDFSPASDKINLIHFSSIPWVQFTALSHARHYDYPDSVPKVSTGKIYQSDSKFLMPVSIHAHHGLVDGLHVGQLIDAIQNTLN